VQINADLQEEKAAAERWKADCLASRSESTAMRKERDSLVRHQRDATGSADGSTVGARRSVRTSSHALAELVKLRRESDYRLPDGRLNLEKIPCRNEVLWSSPGSLEPLEEVTAAQRKGSWTVLKNVLRVQWHAMTESWKAIDDHIEHVDSGLDVYEAMYECARTGVSLVLLTPSARQ
jgi:hypothetical protein